MLNRAEHSLPIGPTLPTHPPLHPPRTAAQDCPVPMGVRRWRWSLPAADDLRRLGQNSELRKFWSENSGVKASFGPVSPWTCIPEDPPVRAPQWAPTRHTYQPSGVSRVHRSGLQTLHHQQPLGMNYFCGSALPLGGHTSWGLPQPSPAHPACELMVTLTPSLARLTGSLLGATPGHLPQRDVSSKVKTAVALEKSLLPGGCPPPPSSTTDHV